VNKRTLSVSKGEESVDTEHVREKGNDKTPSVSENESERIPSVSQ
jgi:hypothetical protein